MSDGFKKNMVLQCLHCQQYLRLPIDVSSGNFPIRLTCLECKGTLELPSGNVLLPKVPPDKNPSLCWGIELNFDKVVGAELAKVAGEEIKRDPYLSGLQQFATDQEGKLDDATAPTPFYDDATQLGKLVAKLFTKVGRLHQSIEKFTDLMGGYFQEKWQWASRFSKQWDRAYLQEFLDMPCMALQCPCEDELAKAYSRWLFAPKFFVPFLGFHIEHNAGMQLELVNQYSRLYFPVESELAKAFGIPEPLDLKVKGNKVIGASLPYCWKEMPGLGKDVDCTEDWPSVYMKNAAQVRVWLAKHGVVPWEPRAITPESLHIREAYESIDDHPLLRKSWEVFTVNGRVGLFWKDVMLARRFAMLSGSMIKGIKAVFIPSHADKVAYDSLYTSFLNTGEGRLNVQEFIYFRNGDNVIWQSVMRAKMVIVDCTRHIDALVLEKLLEYEGKVVLICDNPLQDFAEENISAALVHALSGYGVFEPRPNNKWTAQRIEDKQIRKMLRAMTVRTSKEKDRDTD